MDNSKIFLTPGFLLLGGMEGVPPPHWLKICSSSTRKDSPQYTGFPIRARLVGDILGKMAKNCIKITKSKNWGDMGGQSNISAGGWTLQSPH